jgi:hypothetical protein
VAQGAGGKEFQPLMRPEGVRNALIRADEPHRLKGSEWPVDDQAKLAEYILDQAADAVIFADRSGKIDR